MSERIPTGPRWWIGNVYYQDGAIGGSLLVGMVAIDEEDGPIGHRLVSEERLERIANFAQWDQTPREMGFVASVRDYVAWVGQETVEQWRHRLDGTGNAMSSLCRGDLRPCIAGGDRAAFLDQLMRHVR